MQLSPQGAGFVRVHEGFVPRWYEDPVGVPTIGIGFTWRSAAFREWWKANKPDVAFARGATMTREEADEALRFLVDREYGAAVNRFLGSVAVPQHVFDGMCSPVFNLGPGSLEWKWAAACKARDFDRAASHLRVTGTTARGKRLAGLVARRKEEAELIRSGDYTVGAAPADAMADGMLIRGERGDAVRELQRDLKGLGLYDGKIDGIFGYGTEEAVMAFQRTQWLKADGYAGPKTLAALRAAETPAPPDVPMPPERPEAPPTGKPAPKTDTKTLGIGAAIVAAIAALIAYFFGG